MRSSRHMAVAIAAMVATSMRAVSEVASFGAQTFESIRATARVTPSRIRREARPRWFRSMRKGPVSRPKKHQRKKPIRAWRRARVLKLRGRRR